MKGTGTCLTCYTCMESTASGLRPAVFLPASPLTPSAWKQALSGHPDRVFADYILWGITGVFHIGANRSVLSLQKGPGNMPSTRQLPHLVREHIHEEMAAGHVLGPLPAHLSSLCHSSPIGLIPKPHQPGKWRLIVDLSSPHG